MRVPGWQALGAAGRIAVVVLAAVLVVLAVVWIANWDLFGSKARLEDKAAGATLQAETTGVELRGEKESAQRVEIVVQTREAAQRSVTDISRKAQSATDATQPLSPDRAERLRDHDEFLCGLRPLQGCPAAPGGDAPAG